MGKGEWVYTTKLCADYEIKREQFLEVEFRLEVDGFVECSVLARSESDWVIPDFESACLSLCLQGEYNQDLVLFYGDRPFSYKRLLGYKEAGNYKLGLYFNENISSPNVTRAFVESLEIHVITANSDVYTIYKHAPVLYGRNLAHPFENRFTDTPLLMFYRTEQLGEQYAIEYHMIFSHEDEGTPTPLLMSKWGRTTDIEWIYKVVLDHGGEVKEAAYQGPKHVTGIFNGNFALGGHPVLQLATANGMVNDVVTSDYRFMFPPEREWNLDMEPRERVMDDFPFTYQVSAWEMLRQHPFEQPFIANSYRLVDLRSYLFVQCAKLTSNPSLKTSIDIQVKLKGSDVWYSSSFGDMYYGHFRCAYDGPYSQFSTTVKLPPQTSWPEIEEICAVWLPGGEDTVVVPKFKAALLDEQYLPGKPVFSAGAVMVSKVESRQTLWTGEIIY